MRAFLSLLYGTQSLLDLNKALSCQGSELVGWAEGRWTHQGIDLNHNFADLNTQLWYAEDDGLVPHTVPNHHLPLPTYYTLPNATVSMALVEGHLRPSCLCVQTVLSSPRLGGS